TDRGEHGDGYIVDFGGRWFQVPVSALALAEEEE
ncbi:nitrogen fixation protein NifZ, partial [Klebsiella variicola]|nr:nitrogen fixation protein NifZ [Klebsiella variicola]